MKLRVTLTIDLVELDAPPTYPNHRRISEMVEEYDYDARPPKRPFLDRVNAHFDRVRQYLNRLGGEADATTKELREPDSSG